MEIHRRSFLSVALVLGVLVFAGYQPSLAPTAAAAVKGAAIHKGPNKAAPRSINKANSLARLAVTQLVKNYAKGNAKSVCNGLTAKMRKSLGGRPSCIAKVRRASSIRPVSNLKIKKVAFRRTRVWADVTGYLTGDRKQRLTVTFKWEGGRYRFDHSLSTLIRLFG